jgi:hypothetical protein
MEVSWSVSRYKGNEVKGQKKYLSFLGQGIKGDLGDMRIELKPDVKPVIKRPYQLNPRIK